MSILRRVHPSIRLRLLMGFLGNLIYATVGSSMTIYYSQYIGAGITGFLLIISSVMVFFVGLYAGHLTDQKGRRPVMLVSSMITFIGGMIATLSNSPWFFAPWLTYAGFLILNFGFGFFDVASSAMIIDLTDESNRKDVYSIQYWIYNLAILFGSALSGIFFRDYLFELLLAISLEELATFIVVLFKIPESFDSEKSPARHENILKSYRTVSKDITFMIYCFASIFGSMIFLQIDYYLPVHLSETFKTIEVFGLEIYGQRMLSIILMVNTILIVAGMTFTNWLTRKWSRSRGIVIGLSLECIGFIIAFIGVTFNVEILAACVFTIGEMIAVPFIQAFRADLMAGNRVGTYTGIFNVTKTLGAVLCGLMLSGSAFYGGAGIIFLMFVIMILSITPLLVSVRQFENNQVENKL
ncbi:MAG: MDR family MFS transporter [Lactovum sp.]